MTRSYKTSAVVLRGRNYGEADRIYTLFSTARGKMDAIAKGVRRTKSHLAGRLEFASRVALGMHRGRSLDVVVSADLEDAQWPDLVRPDRFAAANIVLELIDGFCEPDLPLPDVYALLTGALSAISRSEAPMELLPRFQLRLLEALGLAPPLETCVRCGKSIASSGAWLDPEQGGFACDACRVAWREVLVLSAEDMRNVRALAAPASGKVKAAVHAQKTSAAAIEILVNHHLGRRTKAASQAPELLGGLQ
ncbi:MAG TPA: DNA repair protein RecO [Candidatus Baltobacteraceae bacterium]|nr:DNA repair protein RecO [Candidatus Baltobacteraceae bacterium]